jgi:hypothetical protein
MDVSSLSCIHEEQSVVSMYFGVEFARDVEIQTHTSGTTQESLAKGLYKSADDMRRWNSLLVAGHNNKAGASTAYFNNTNTGMIRTKTGMSETELIPIPGSAICVINAGLHYRLIKDVTDAAYINNVRWYIRTMQNSGVCTQERRKNQLVINAAVCDASAKCTTCEEVQLVESWSLCLQLSSKSDTRRMTRNSCRICSRCLVFHSTCSWNRMG